MTATAALTVTLRQPAQVSDRARADYVLGTLTYLPGWVVRGAYAARWLATRGGIAQPGTARRALFERLFEGGVRFGPLFADNPPQPLSLLLHKYPETAECPYIALDRALADTAEIECPACRSPWEPAKGAVAGPAPRRRTHVTVGEGQVAARGGLISRETLPSGTAFTGMVVADDADLLGELGRLGRIHVGGRRTTHGGADTALVTPAPAPPAPTPLPNGRLVVSLRSPGLFVDDLGRPSVDPNPDELSRVLGQPTQVVRRWARWVSVGGWHAASGLPKPVEVGVAAGSTYLLATDGPIGEAAVTALARRGLGLRRHEGFGDLGGAAVIPPGRVARDEEQRRITMLGQSVAALRSFQVSPVWPRLTLLLRSAAGGDAVATQHLRRIAQQWRQPQQQALETFLTFDAENAWRIVDGWG